MKMESMKKCSRKDEMGFLSAQKRPMCSNCKHVNEDWVDRWPNDICTWSCKKGGFKTSAHAWCKEWEAESAS
jgi:RNase P subunit RPR2